MDTHKPDTHIKPGVVRKGGTLLHWACHAGCLPCVNKIIVTDPDAIYVTCKDNNTCISYAVENQHEHIIKRLIEAAGPNIWSILQEENVYADTTVLHRAAGLGNVPIARMLIDASGTNAFEFLSCRAWGMISPPAVLDHAVVFGHKPMVKYLIEAAGDRFLALIWPNIKEKDYQFITFPAKENNVEIVKMIINAGGHGFCSAVYSYILTLEDSDAEDSKAKVPDTAIIIIIDACIQYYVLTYPGGQIANTEKIPADVKKIIFEYATPDTNYEQVHEFLNILELGEISKIINDDAENDKYHPICDYILKKQSNGSTQEKKETDVGIIRMIIAVGEHGICRSICNYLLTTQDPDVLDTTKIIIIDACLQYYIRDYPGGHIKNIENISEYIAKIVNFYVTVDDIDTHFGAFLDVLKQRKIINGATENDTFRLICDDIFKNQSDEEKESNVKIIKMIVNTGKPDICCSICTLCNHFLTTRDPDIPDTVKIIIIDACFQYYVPGYLGNRIKNIENISGDITQIINFHATYDDIDTHFGAFLDIFKQKK